MIDVSALRSDFMLDAARRGMARDCSDAIGLDAAAAKGEAIGYVGFDCTAPSLHAGSLLPIMLLRKLQRSGNRPIVLLGGGTTKIGDPSGRDTARALLDQSVIDANKSGIRKTFGRFLRFGDGPTDAKMVDNADWLDSMELIPFLREIGSRFGVGRMLALDAVRTRLESESSMSFLEFGYPLLQAYDFLHLSRAEGCLLQMGGSDQWGNIVNGIELIRRADGREAFGLTAPLLETAGGAKMGKTARGAVWLDAELTSPYLYWQYWRNVADDDVGRFLRLFTEIEEAEIERLSALEGAEANAAKSILADEATAMAHGRDAAQRAASGAKRMFEDDAASDDAPAATISRARLRKGFGLLDALRATRLTASNGEGRRLVRDGGARVNGVTVSDEGMTLTEEHLDDHGAIRLAAGRKRRAALKIVDDVDVDPAPDSDVADSS